MSTLPALEPRLTQDPPANPPGLLTEPASPQDPGATRYAASIARSVAFTLLRAAHGDRIPRHLSGSVSKETLEKIQTRMNLLQSSRSAEAGSPRTKTRLGPATLRVGRTRVSEVAPGIFECVVLCHGPQSVRACALRLNRAGGRWTVLDFEFA